MSLLTQFWYQNRDIDMQNTPYQVRSMIQQLRGIWSPVNKIDNLNRDFFPMPRLNFEFEFDTHLQVALVI